MLSVIEVVSTCDSSEDPLSCILKMKIMKQHVSWSVQTTFAPLILAYAESVVTGTVRLRPDMQTHSPAAAHICGCIDFSAQHIQASQLCCVSTLCDKARVREQGLGGKAAR